MTRSGIPLETQGTITIEHEGRPFTGRYRVEDGEVVVRLGADLRTGPLGGEKARDVARRLMYELVREE